ncbi:hypothetical protein DFH09DRAFT_1100689 [Mycena vulgaris]|nr:hypothetical protein DFH09DRAFT_1100689 [Mycena vulgaris]
MSSWQDVENWMCDPSAMFQAAATRQFFSVPAVGHTPLLPLPHRWTAAVQRLPDGAPARGILDTNRKLAQGRYDAKIIGIGQPRILTKAIIRQRICARCSPSGEWQSPEDNRPLTAASSETIHKNLKGQRNSRLSLDAPSNIACKPPDPSNTIGFGSDIQRRRKAPASSVPESTIRHRWQFRRRCKISEHFPLSSTPGPPLWTTVSLEACFVNTLHMHRRAMEISITSTEEVLGLQLDIVGATLSDLGVEEIEGLEPQTSYMGAPFLTYPVEHAIKVGVDGLDFSRPNLTASIGALVIL